MAEAAARESLEEAGLRGELQARGQPWRQWRSLGLRSRESTFSHPALPQELGKFPFTSKSSHCEAHVFVMRVTEELAVWPEREGRRRVWFSVQDALLRCRHDWMRRAISEWHTGVRVPT